MKIVGRDGQCFALEVAGYQFPALTRAGLDSNWLDVRLKVNHTRGTWSAKDPCLLTGEAGILAKWLEDLSRGASAPDELSFVEPNLVFRLVDLPVGKTLRIFFELEIRPAWARSNVAGQEDLWVDFPLDEVDLVQAAQDLRRQIRRYPTRQDDA